MPFDNLSGASDEYFVDGVVEEITAALSRVRDFFVIAQAVGLHLQGPVRRRARHRPRAWRRAMSSKARCGAAATGCASRCSSSMPRRADQLWSDRFEGGPRDMFEFQDRIAAHVAGAIHPAVRQPRSQLARLKPPSNLRAYDLVLQAYPKIWSQSRGAHAQAIAILGNAIATCSDYGRAHALLAWCHSQDQVTISGRPIRRRAAQAAGRAVDARRAADRRRSDRAGGRAVRRSANRSTTCHGRRPTSTAPWRSILTMPGPGRARAGSRSIRTSRTSARERFERSPGAEPARSAGVQPAHRHRHDLRLQGRVRAVGQAAA